MKKLLSVLTAMAVLGSLTCGVFAAGPAAGDDRKKDLSDDANSKTVIDVSAKLTHGGEVYYVDVEWESMEFTYEFGTWDPEEHEYDDATGAWENADGNATSKVTVLNHSNDQVNVKATQADKSSTDGLSIELSGDATADAGDTLDDASITGIYGDFDKADKTEIIVTPKIDLECETLPAVDTAVTIATITVVLEAV